MAASMLLIAAVVDAGVVWFARQWLQFAAELLCKGGVWTLGTARNFSALSRKVAPGVDVGNLICARLRSNASSPVKLNSGVRIAL